MKPFWNLLNRSNKSFGIILSHSTFRRQSSCTINFNSNKQGFKILSGSKIVHNWLGSALFVGGKVFRTQSTFKVSPLIFHIIPKILSIVCSFKLVHLSETSDLGNVSQISELLVIHLCNLKFADANTFMITWQICKRNFSDDVDLTKSSM